MRKLIFNSLLVFSLFSSQSFAIPGTPGGLPEAPPTVTTSSYAPGATSTDLTVTWTEAADGGSAITGYFATAWTATSGGVPIAATTATCNTVGAATFTCPITGLNFKTYYIVRVYARNANGAGPATDSTLVTTPASSQTVDFDAGSPTTATYNGADLTVHATATSGLTATYASRTPTICTVTSDAGLVHALLAGTCTIRATQDGVGSAFDSANTGVAGHPDLDIEVAPQLAATIDAATYIQSTQATLNALVPFSGKSTTPKFCISTTDPIVAPATTPPNSCTNTVTVGTYSRNPITQSSEGGAITAVASGLTPGTKYWVWILAEATGSTTVASNTTVNFTTTVGPSLTGDAEITVDQGSNIAASFTASSGSGVYPTWEYGDLPDGTSFTPGVSGASITGTATTAAIVSTWVKVTDSNNLSATWPITFTVKDPTKSDSKPDPLAQFKCSDEIKLPPDPTVEPGATSFTTQSGKLPECYSKNLDPNNSEIPPILPLIIPNNPYPIVVEGGTEGPVRVTINKPKTDMGLETDNWSLHLSTTAGVVNSSNRLQPSDATQVVIEKGHTATTKGTGFAPRTRVYLYISSTTQLLGVLQTDGSGNFIGTFPLPNELELGQHHIQVNGWSKAKKIRSATVGLRVIQQSGKSLKARIFYGLNLSNLTKESLTTLKSLVTQAKKNFAADHAKKIVIQVVGYTQPTKKNPFPGKLSTNRANAVANYLKSKGIVGKYVITGAGNARKNVAASRMAEVTINWG
jgi:outer membrane protein OmpA-like peptidoglycan-associated protein